MIRDFSLAAVLKPTNFDSITNDDSTYRLLSYKLARANVEYCFNNRLSLYLERLTHLN
jgi:hypothetical protein